MRYLLLLICAAVISACNTAAPQENPEEKASHSPELGFQPNIVWIVAEDLSPFLPDWGDPTIETPNISRLVAEGVKYTHVFSPSGVCAPSRAAISTGMYPASIGAHHMRTGGNPKYFPKGLTPYEALPDPEIQMHSERLRRAGYYCTNNSKEDLQYKKPPTAWDESSNQAHWKNREPGQPFFAIFNLGVTHESRIWAKAEDSLWVDENLNVNVPPYLPDNEVGQTDVRRMYSNIKEMDAQVGDLLAELEAANLMDSTIIFWYSDHGGPLPRMKRLVYDSGIRLPMVIRFPNKFRAGETDDQFVSFIDFKPTIMSLAGIEPGDFMDGKAFLGTYARTEEAKYVHAGGDRFDGKYDMIRAVRDKQYKYIRNFQPEKPMYLPVAYRENMPVMKELLRMREAGELNEVQALWFKETKAPVEFYDLEKDPHEVNNLADDPTYADKIKELSEEMDRWMEEIGDRGRIEEHEYLESIWPGLIQPETTDPLITEENGKISISSETAGASIGYQILEDGEEAGERWEVYIGPVEVPEGKRLIAVAHRIGYKRSEIVEKD
ncbi:MAG: sulfatase [Bacteroidota bacterium]